MAFGSSSVPAPRNLPSKTKNAYAGGKLGGKGRGEGGTATD